MRLGKAILFAIATAVPLAGRTRAAPVERDDDPHDRRMKFLRGARKGVVLLRTELGVASGTVLEREAGLVACAKGSLDSAGRVEAHFFATEVPERGPDLVKRVELGEAEVLAIHRSADAALLRVDLPAGAVAFPFARGPVEQGAEVAVLGVRGAAPFETAGDLSVRRGVVGEGGEAARTPLTAPTHRNSAGGAVLLGPVGSASRSGRAGPDGTALIGVASFDLPAGGIGAAVPLGRFLELRDGLKEDAAPHAMPAREAAEYTRAKGGPPPFWPVSPPDPGGKEVSFGQGVRAVVNRGNKDKGDKNEGSKGARAVLATGVFVLDGDEPLEYLATPLERGKLHETVIAVDADPATLNLAFMALKYRSGGWIQRAEGAVPFGTRLRLYVEWDAAEARAIRKWLRGFEPAWERPDFRGAREKVREGAMRWVPGPTVRVRAEDLMFNVREGHPMVHTDWLYTGSGFVKDDDGRHLFRATLDGVLVAVYHDPAAMFNIPLETGADDTYYCTRGCFNPPRGTSCTLVFLPAEADEAAR